MYYGGLGGLAGGGSQNMAEYTYRHKYIIIEDGVLLFNILRSCSSDTS